MPDEFDDDRSAQPSWKEQVAEQYWKGGPSKRDLSFRARLNPPTPWEIAHQREADAGEGTGPGELPRGMSPAEALSAAEADLPAPDMRAALRDRAMDLGESGAAEAPGQGPARTGEGSAWRRFWRALRRGR
jgi:hypothetical protein